MIRQGIFSGLALALMFGIASLATAHHPAKMERCESFEFSGQLTRIEWHRPHVELFVRSDDGETYQLTWLAINQLEVAGIHQDTLRIGDQLTVIAGVRPNDIVERPMLLNYLHRDRDDWGWTEVPQGC
jgi:hypothetical protein